MSTTAFREMKPYSQFILTAFIILVSFIIFMFVGMVLAIPLFGFDALLAMESGLNINDPESLKLLKYLQIVQSFGLFIVPPFIIATLFDGNIDEYLLLNKKVTGGSVFYITLLILFALPLINFLGEWNSQMQ